MGMYNNSDAVDLVNARNPWGLLEKSLEKDSVYVKGRLKDHYSFWHGINANQWVISIIRDGYALPFVELPPANQMAIHKSAFEEKDFVTQQIEELLLAGCITEVSRSDVHVVSPLSVVKKSIQK